MERSPIKRCPLEQSPMEAWFCVSGVRATRQAAPCGGVHPEYALDEARQFLREVQGDMVGPPANPADQAGILGPGEGYPLSHQQVQHYSYTCLTA